MDRAFEFLDRIIYWLAGFGAIFISLLVYIYKGKVSDINKQFETEKKERATADDKLQGDIDIEAKNRKESIDECKKFIKEINRETIAIFKEGVEKERDFRSGISIKQGEMIEKLVEKMEDFNIKQNIILTTLTDSIKHQEKICNERHKDE